MSINETMFFKPKLYQIDLQIFYYSDIPLQSFIITKLIIGSLSILLKYSFICLYLKTQCYFKRTLV